MELLEGLNGCIQSFYEEDSMALDINKDTMVKFNVYDAMLFNLLAGPVAAVNNVIDLDYLPTEEDFIKYLIRAKVKYNINKLDNEAVSIKDMFKQCIQTYDIEVHYNYELSVYGVLLKIIYGKLNKVIDDIISNMNNTSKSPQLYKIYSDSLTALQTIIIDLPIDAFGDINLLSTYGVYQIDGAKQVVENRLQSLSHIILLPEREEFSLVEIVKCITDKRFQQFWWVFNTLHLAETGKQSNYVYGTSLKLASTSIPRDDFNYFFTLRYECQTLKTIYYNFFRINLIIKSFKDSKPKDLRIKKNDRSVFLKVHNYNRILSDHLSELIEVWFENKNLKLGDDLLKILMTIIIRLKNTKYHIDVYNMSSNYEYKLEILNKNIDDLERIGDYIMSLLDNYLIGKCETVNNRKSNYKYFKNNLILNHDIVNSILVFNIPIKQDREVENYRILDNTEKSRNIKYLSKEWYRLLFFVEENQIISSQRLRLIMGHIHFNFNGLVIDITKQIILSKSTFSLSYLVEYVSNFFKSIFSSMYIVLVIIFCDDMVFQEKELINSFQENLINAFTLFKKLGFPDFCNPYINSIKFIRKKLKKRVTEEKVYTRTVGSEIKNLMLTEIEKLGVVNVETTLKVITKKASEDKEFYICFKEMLAEIQDLMNTLRMYEDMHNGKPFNTKK